MYSISYSPEGDPVAIKREENQIISFIPLDEGNADFIQFLQWNFEQAAPLDWHAPIEPTPLPEELYTVFDKPVKAPDFIVATPPVNPDPEKALDEAIAEMEKGEGNPKSIALIALFMAKWAKAERVKNKALEAEIAELKKKVK